MDKRDNSAIYEGTYEREGRGSMCPHQSLSLALSYVDRTWQIRYLDVLNTCEWLHLLPDGLKQLDIICWAQLLSLILLLLHYKHVLSIKKHSTKHLSQRRSLKFHRIHSEAQCHSEVKYETKRIEYHVF